MTSSLPLLTHPKVMISYSQEDDSHKEWVQRLADQLAASGIDPIIDCYDLRAGISMTHFMEKAVADAYKVLLILTPVYKTKADDRKGGVGYEHTMNSQELYENQTAGKFIPIIRRGNFETATPRFIRSLYCIDMTDDTQYGTRFQDLLNAIADKPAKTKPPLGPAFQLNVPLAPATNTSHAGLIDDQQQMAINKMPHFYKWSFILDIPFFLQKHASVLYSLLRDNAVTIPGTSVKYPAILTDRCKSSHTPFFLFELPYSDYTNHFTQEALKIDRGLIQYEFAEYCNTPVFTWELMQPFTSLVYLLSILTKLSVQQPFDSTTTLFIRYTANHESQLNVTKSPIQLERIFGYQTMTIPGNHAALEITFPTFSKDSIFAAFQELYTIFSNKNPAASLPYIELQRAAFDEMWRKLLP